MSEHSCPECLRPFATARALAIHLSHAHGAASTNPKTMANRKGREPQPRTPIDAGGPVALLVAVIALARTDARHDWRARRWLQELRSDVSGVSHDHR